MRALTFPGSSQNDWSFRIGLGLVGLFAAVELLAAGYYYAGRFRPARAATAAAGPAAVAPAAPAKVAPTAPPAAPVAAPSATIAAAAAATPSTSTLSEADRLLQEATALRERGDTTTALARLQEATQRDPKNAQVLAEMAAIYESMQLYDRSNETWRKIEDIGPSAGAVYDLAKTKLKLGPAAPGKVTAPPAASVAPPATAASPGTEMAAAAKTGSEGIPDGSIFGITDLTVTETPDPEAETNLTLRIAIKARPHTVIDHTKVTIRVYFYDTVGTNPQPVLTDAQTSHEWLTPNHDWIASNPEVLSVTYFRPKNQASSEAELSAAAAAVIPGKKPRIRRDAAAALNEAGQRHYLGYIVRVYYNDKLQAQEAQPTRLLDIFPSSTASP
jgi:tetratricopeptide (TPR) repeat protein